MATKKSQKTVKKQRQMHPNSLANLQPFTGGPDPRRNMQGPVPQDQKELNELIDEIFAEQVKSGKTSISKLRGMLERLLKNTPGAIHLLDRRYGKVKEVHEVTGKDGKDFTLRIIREDTKPDGT